MSTKVQGWTNGVTWDLAVRLDNHEPTYIYWQNQGKASIKRGWSLERFASFCKCHLDNRPRRNVNWLEIAAHIRGVES